MCDVFGQAPGATQPERKGESPAGLVIGARLARTNQVLLGNEGAPEPVQPADLIRVEWLQELARSSECRRLALSWHRAGAAGCTPPLLPIGGAASQA